MRTFTETLAMAYMIFMVLLFVDIASGEAPIFYFEGDIEANGSPIDVGYQAIPAFGVWDMSGSGACDLVVGSGEGITTPIRIYETTTTPPTFEGYSTLMTLPANFVKSMNVVDWGMNGAMPYDDHPDLIVNNTWYRRSGTSSLYPAEEIKDVTGTALRGTAVCIGDWDGDGDLDALSGMNTSTGFTTSICLYTNIATSENYPILAAPTVIATCASFNTWSYPAMGDLDNDGDTDLLVATGNHIQFWRNDSGILVYDGEVQGGQGIGTIKGVSDQGESSSMRIALVDWENDGDLDLVTCDKDGRLSLWTSYLSCYPNFPISVARESADVAYTTLPELCVEQNPCVDGVLRLTVPETTGVATLGLYSCAGRLMDEVQFEVGMNSLTYDVSTYPAGVYFITMTDGVSMTSTRVVVE